jgi:uncharacterized membrane protein
MRADSTRSFSFLRERWVLGAMVAAAALQLWGLDQAALWYDETFTAQWVILPWQEMIRTVLLGDYGANHLPLYFIAVKLWTTWAGLSPLALRAPSVVFGVAAVAATASFAAALTGPRAARLAAWLAALSPFLLQHAQEARMYTLIVLLAAISLTLLARYLRGNATHLGFGFLLVNIALLATHYYAMFFVAGELMALLWLRLKPLRAWLPAAATLAIVTAAGPVLVAITMATQHAGGSYGLGVAALPGLVWSLLSGYTLLPTSEALHAAGLRAALPYVPIAISGCVSLLIVATGGWRELDREARVLLLAILGMVIIAPFAVSMIRPVAVNPRYTAAALPALLVLLACGAPVRARVNAPTAAMAALVGIFVLGSVLHLAQPGHGREDVKAAGAWLAEHAQPSQQLIITSSEMADLAHFHWPSRSLRLYPPRKEPVTRTNAGAVAAAFPFGSEPEGIYVIGRAWLSDPDELLVNALRNTYEQCTGASLRGIQILCLKRPTAAPIRSTQAGQR